MASLLVFTNFSKKANSTKQPQDSSGSSFTVVMKDDCSLDAPVFIMKGAAYSHAPNYVKFDGCYYYVDDIVSLHNGLVELHCSKDYLASHKADIQAGNAFVLYYSHSQTEITDNRLASETTDTVQTSTDTFLHLGTGQSYLMTVVGVEGTSVYACSKADVDDLFTHPLLTTYQNAYDQEVENIALAVDAVSITDMMTTARAITSILLRALKIFTKIVNTKEYAKDAGQFVKNCYSLPIAKSDIGGSSSLIKIGAWDSNAYGHKGFPRILHDSATLAIPWQASDWRRNAPFHSIYVYIPYIGLISIPPSQVIDVTNITVNVSVDTYSGVTTFVINADSGAVLGQYSTNIAAAYAIGSANIDLTAAGAQVVASMAGIAAGAVAGNYVSATSGAMGLSNIIKTLDNSISSNSGAAGMGLGNTVKCFTVFHDTTVDPHSVSAIAGEPHNGVMSLSGISGFVQTLNASIAMSGLGKDKEIVNNYLNGGIYIE